MKILIVEDEILLADSLQALLAKNGFTVDVAYDGESGEEYAQLGVYDLLILDVMMPKRNGYELAKADSAFCGAQRTPMRFRADAVRSITDALKRLL